MVFFCRLPTLGYRKDPSCVLRPCTSSSLVEVESPSPPGKIGGKRIDVTHCTVDHWIRKDVHLAFEIDHVWARGSNVRNFLPEATEASSSAVKITAKEVVRRAANDDSILIAEANAARRIFFEGKSIQPIIVFLHWSHFDDVINSSARVLFSQLSKSSESSDYVILSLKSRVGESHR